MEGLKEIVNRTTKIFRVAERELENKGDSANRVITNLSIANYDILKTEWKGGLSDLKLYSLQGVGHGISWNTIGDSMWEFMKSHIKN